MLKAGLLPRPISARADVPQGRRGRRGESGEVLVDVDKCIGCRNCLAHCPWGAPMFNVQGRTGYWADKAPLVVIAVSPHRRRTPGKAERCTLCVHRKVPACVEACKLEVLMLVDYDNPAPEQKDLIAKSRAMNRIEANYPKVRFVCANVDVATLEGRWQGCSLGGGGRNGWGCDALRSRRGGLGPRLHVLFGALPRGLPRGSRRRVGGRVGDPGGGAFARVLRA